MTDKPIKGESTESSSVDTERAGSQDLKQLQELYELMLAEGLDSVELKDEDTRIRLTRRSLAPIPNPPVHYASAPTPTPTASAPVDAEPAPDDSEGITAPLAGVFYRASSPTAAPFVKEGDTVDPGQTLCIVEAMKVMNEIKAEKRCRIVRIPAENSRPVTAGQVLFKVEPA